MYFHYYRGVVDSVITINGTGLGSEACQNVVMFGDTNCTVLSQSDTWLTCEVSNQTDILLTNRNVASVSDFWVRQNAKNSSLSYCFFQVAKKMHLESDKRKPELCLWCGENAWFSYFYYNDYYSLILSKKTTLYIPYPVVRKIET